MEYKPNKREGSNRRSITRNKNRFFSANQVISDDHWLIEGAKQLEEEREEHVVIGLNKDLEKTQLLKLNKKK